MRSDAIGERVFERARRIVVRDDVNVSRHLRRELDARLRAHADNRPYTFRVEHARGDVSQTARNTDDECRLRRTFHDVESLRHRRRAQPNRRAFAPRHLLRFARDLIRRHVDVLRDRTRAGFGAPEHGVADRKAASGICARDHAGEIKPNAQRFDARTPESPRHPRPELVADQVLGVDRIHPGAHDFHHAPRTRRLARVILAHPTPRTHAREHARQNATRSNAHGCILQSHAVRASTRVRASRELCRKRHVTALGRHTVDPNRRLVPDVRMSPHCLVMIGRLVLKFENSTWIRARASFVRGAARAWTSARHRARWCVRTSSMEALAMRTRARRA